MKFLIAFAAVAAVAVAVPVQRALVSPGLAGPAPIVDENGSPVAIGPAVIDFSPISVGPAIVEANPIAVGPAIIDFPLPDGGAVTAEEPALVIPSPAVQPSPVVVGEVPAGSSPLVQIIVNVQSQQESIVAPSPADTPVVEEVFVPGPVNVVDNVIAPEPVVVEPIVVVEPTVPGPVNVVDGVVIPVEPVQVVEPIVVEPIIVGTPIIPAPAVVLPDILN